jgi:hypothetical protein
VLFYRGRRIAHFAWIDVMEQIAQSSRDFFFVYACPESLIVELPEQPIPLDISGTLGNAGF